MSTSVTLYNKTFPSITSAAAHHDINRDVMSQLLMKYGENKECFEKKIEEVKKRKKKGPVSVTLYGQTFPTIKSAAAHHGISTTTIGQLLKKYGENQELFEIEVVETKKRKRKEPVTVKLYGQTFPTIKSAAAHHGIDRDVMSQLLMKYGENKECFEKKVEESKKRKKSGRIITLYDQTYPTIKSAAYDHDICKKVMNQLYKKYGKNQKLFEKEVEEAKKRKAMRSVPVTLFGYTYKDKKEAAESLGISYPCFRNKFMTITNPERLLLSHFFMRIQRVSIRNLDYNQLPDIYSHTDEKGVDYFSYAGNIMSSTEILEKWLNEKKDLPINVFAFANVEYPSKIAFLEQYNLDRRIYNKLIEKYPSELECMEYIKINQIERFLDYMGLSPNRKTPCYAFKSTITGENHYLIFDKSKIENYDNLSCNRQKELRYSETTSTHKIMSQSQILELWEKHKQDRVREENI